MRIKKILLIVAYFGTICTVMFPPVSLGDVQTTSQEEPFFTVDWETTVGGNSYEIVKTVIKTNDNGYIAAGYTESYGAGGPDAFIVKVDANGNLLWNKSFGGLLHDEIWEITDTADGNFILVGETWSFGAGGSDVWLLKIDTDGNLLWNKTFGLADVDWGTAIARSGDNIYVTGTFRPIFGGPVNLLLLKIDQDGNFLWNKSYGIGRGFEIITVGNNGTLITGVNADDFILLRTDDQGNELWRKIYGGPLRDFCTLVTSTPDGGFIVAGPTNSFGAGGDDTWIIKVDKDGNHEWNKTFGGFDHDYPNAILNYKDGGYLLGIHSLTYGPGNGDNWIIKLNQTGEPEWNQTTGYNLGDDFAHDMIEVAEDKYVLAGTTEVGGVNSDVWIFQITLSVPPTPESSVPSTPESSVPSTPESSGFLFLSVLVIPVVILFRKHKVT